MRRCVLALTSSIARTHVAAPGQLVVHQHAQRRWASARQDTHEGGGEAAPGSTEGAAAGGESAGWQEGTGGAAPEGNVFGSDPLIKWKPGVRDVNLGAKYVPKAKPNQLKVQYDNVNKDLGEIRPMRSRKKRVKQDPYAPRHPTEPAKLEHPPWIRTRYDLENKTWINRKAGAPEWVLKRFQRFSKSKEISWEGFFTEDRQPTVRNANYLMRLMISQGRNAEALKVFRQLPAKGFSPNAWSYVSALDAAARLRDASSTHALIAEMKGSDKDSQAGYAAAVKALLSVGETERAAEMLQESSLAGVEPNIVTYTTLMTAAAEEGDLKAVDNLRVDMMVAGVMADQVTYNVLLLACARGADGPKALDVFEEMAVYAIPRDAAAYNYTIQALCKSEMLEEANKLFTEMLTLGHQGNKELAPSLATYTIILQSYAAQGDVDNALAMLEAVKAQGVELDFKARVTLIDACLTAAQRSELLPERRRLAVRAETFLKSALAELRVGQVLDKDDKRKLMTKAMSVWASGLYADEAEGYLDRFAEEGLDPGPLAFAILMNMHERRADGARCERLLERMREFGMMPSASFVLTAALAYARAMDKEKALVLLRRLKDFEDTYSGSAQRYSLQYALGKVWSPPNEWDYPLGEELPEEEVYKWREEVTRMIGPYVKPPHRDGKLRREKEREALLDEVRPRYEMDAYGKYVVKRDAKLLLLQPKLNKLNKPKPKLA
mmetsp:Transcript_18417/g.45224  ORF Transcript_18417/g.45224 Transcript_18417/m.45224 type:complete len:721 (-) Transcript_18417:184-2346(-)